MGKQSNKNVKTYTGRELGGFLTGLAGQNIIYNIIAAGLLFYFQSVIFLPAMAVSLIFALARVWDAINDPMMGTIVDKTRTKWGKCKPYLLFVPAAVCVATILPFVNSMYAWPNDKYDVEAADIAAYVEYNENTFTEHETVTFEEKEYLVVSLNNSWDVTKNEDGEKIKTPVMVYEIGADGSYTAVEDLTLAETVVGEFQNTYGFTKVAVGKGVAIIAWAAISYVLWGMVYTIGDIPLWGVTSLMTEDQNDRAKALSLARIVANVGAIGMMFTFIAPSFNGVFMAKGMDEAHALRMSYIVTAIIMTVFSSILFEVAGLSVKEKVTPSAEKRYTIKDNFRIMFSNRPFRQILISGVLRSPVLLLSTVAMTLVMYYFCNSADDPVSAFVTPDGFNVSLLLKVVVVAIGIFGGMIGVPAFVPALARKFEKKKLYNFFCLMGAVPFALVFVIFKVSGGDILSWGWIIVMGVLFFMASAAMGALNVLQSVMIADCVDYEEYTNGVRTDGVFFSGQSFITKLSSGIASLITGIVYTIVGFSGANVALLNNALINGAKFVEYNGGSYASAMFFLVSIPPAIGMVLSALPTLKYALSDQEHTRILDVLNARRHGSGADAE